MEKLVITRKGTAPSKYYIGGFLILVLAFFGFYTSFDPDLGSRIEIHEVMSFVAPFLLLVASCTLFISAYRHGKAQISIYTDHIEGIGVSGKVGTKSRNFNFASGDSYVIKQDDNFIIIECRNESYYIHLFPKDAGKILTAVTNEKEPTPAK